MARKPVKPRKPVKATSETKGSRNKTRNAHTENSDWTLYALVGFADMSGVQTTITVATPAGFITGLVIGTAEYYRRTADVWDAGWKGEGKTPETSPGQIWRKMYERFEARREEQLEEGEERGEAGFIHIADARIVSGASTIPQGSGLLWRGRLSEVIGYSLGSLGPALR